MQAFLGGREYFIQRFNEIIFFLLFIFNICMTSVFDNVNADADPKMMRIFEPCLFHTLLKFCVNTHSI